MEKYGFVVSQLTQKYQILSIFESPKEKMMCIKLTTETILKKVRKWIKRCWTCQLCANAERSQSSPAEVAATDSFELSSSSSETREPSEMGSPYNTESMSRLEDYSGRTQRLQVDLAQISMLPCSEAHPLLSRYLSERHNLGRSEHVGNRGLKESTRGGAGKQTQSRGTLSSEWKMTQLSHRTNTEITDSELRCTAGNLDRSCKAPTRLSNRLTDKKSPSQTEGEDEGKNHSVSQPLTFRHVVASPKGDSQLTSCSSDKRPSCSLLSRTPINRDRLSLTPPRNQTGTPVPTNGCTVETGPSSVQGECSASSPRSNVSQNHPTLVEMKEDTSKKRTTANETLHSSTESLGSSASDSSDDSSNESLGSSASDSSDDSGSSYDSSEETEASGSSAQSLKDGNKDTVCRPKERLTNKSLVEEKQCRFCHGNETSPENPFLSPCKCSGSMKFIHFDCLKQWLQIRIESGSFLLYAQKCEVCKEELQLDPNTFDWIEFYLKHQQNQPIDPEEDPTRRQIMTTLRELEVEVLSMHYRRTGRALRPPTTSERSSEQQQPPDGSSSA